MVLAFVFRCGADSAGTETSKYAAEKTGAFESLSLEYVFVSQKMENNTFVVIILEVNLSQMLTSAL